jgi:putative phosphoribosyl transferase
VLQGAHASIVRFLDRAEAGLHLANALRPHATPGAVVLAIPRGGVVTGVQVARRLGLELDVVVTCRVDAPGHPELGLGAVAEGGVRNVDLGLASVLNLSPAELRGAVRDAEAEMQRRVLAYRQARPLPDLRGRAALVVDDGIARGTTVRAAVESLRTLRPARVVVAAPVVALTAAYAIEEMVDAVVALVRPAVMRNIAEWYQDYPPLHDGEVLAWLAAGKPPGDQHVAA